MSRMNWPRICIFGRFGGVDAAAGTALVRSQGLRALDALRTSFDELRDPTDPLAHGAMILLSGALLLTPGFFTDAVGFALLVPSVRRRLTREVRRRIAARGAASSPGHRATGGDVIDGTFRVEPDPRAGPRDASGWTRD